MSDLVVAATQSSTVLLDSIILRGDGSAPAATVNITGATCSAWGAEGDVFIGTLRGSIERINKSNANIGTIYAGDQPVVALVAWDATSLIVGHENYVSIIEASSGSVVRPPIPITGTLQSLALSNDKELLSITTESDITVYNLISNVSTPLNVRHLPAAFGRSAFHPLRRTTLITICGKQLVVFDSNKPTSPPKVVALSPMSRVVDMAFIPSGKGLLAAANERGGVYIVDIEKDKPVVRSLDFKQSLRTLGISVDGSQIVVGTNEGQLLVQNIRPLDKVIRSIPTGRQEPIIILAINNKQDHAIKATSTRTALAKVSTTARILSDRNAQRAASSTKSVRKTPIDPDVPIREAVRSKTTVSTVATSPEVARKRTSKETPRRENTPPPASFSNTDRRKAMSPRATKESASRTVRRVSGNTSTTGSPGSTRSASRSRPIERPSSTNGSLRRISSALSKTTAERTNTPDLPIVDASSIFHEHNMIPPIHPLPSGDGDPTFAQTPVVAIDLADSPKATTSQLPEADIWLGEAQRADSRGKTGIVPPNYRESTPPINFKHANMQLVATPPRRPQPTKRAFGSGVMQVSPMRSPVHLSTPNALQAQELIRAAVREALTERDEEHREELRALHLDLIKMSRTMKNELQALMEEYVGDFRALREENQKLRLENERLRRGY